MGSACRKSQDTENNHKYSIEKEMDDALGKPTQPLFLILQTGWASRRLAQTSLFIKFMKNVLCWKPIHTPFLRIFNAVLKRLVVFL